MCTQCTVPRRVQDEYVLDWGKQHTNKTNKDRGGKLKVGREMPSQEHGEHGQCGDLEIQSP